MAYEALIQYIESIVRANGNEEITGTNMQAVLKAIVDVVGASEFRGVASPVTNPGTIIGYASYITAVAGTYNNFGGIEISQGELAILKWTGAAWTKQTIQSYVSDVFVRDYKGIPFVKSLIKTKGTEETEVTILPSANGVITGGIVSWSGTDLRFNFSYVAYIINNQFFHISSQTFDLDASDPTHDRIDVVAVNDQGNIDILKGTPAASPIKPQVNYQQLELTYIVVPAGASSPAVNELVIWNENTESIGAATDINANFDNLLNPHTGLKAVNAANILDNGKLTFTLPDAVEFADYSTLSMFFRLKQNIPIGAKILVQFFLADKPVSDEQALMIEPDLLNTYQFVAIALNSFRLSGSEFDVLQIRYTGFNYVNGFYLDYIRLEGGIASPIVEGWYFDTQTEFGVVRSLIRSGDNVFFQAKASSRIKLERYTHVQNGNVLEIDFNEEGLLNTKDDITFEYRDVDGTDNTYVLRLKSTYKFTINALTLIVDNGTIANIAVKINTTAVTGLSAVTATTTRTTTNATALNTVQVDDYVTITLGARTSATKLIGELHIIRS